MANMIARLGVALGIETAEFNRGIEQAGKKLEQFSEAAEKFGKIGAVALVAASVAAVKYADELFDVAEANEMALGTVLKLSNALQDSGGKADNAGKMLSAFTKFIDDAAGGSEQAQKTAKELGVTLQDLGKLSQEELLNKLVANLAAVEDPITRNAKAMEIFSKAAKGVDMVGFAERIAQANPLIAEQEKAIKAAADVMEFFEGTSRNVMLTLVTELGPVLKATIDYFDNLAGKTNVFGSVCTVVFQTAAVVAANVAFVIKGIVTEIELLVKQTIALATFDFAKFKSLGEEGRKEALANLAALQAFEFRVMGSPDGRRGLDDPRIPQASRPSGPVRATRVAEDPLAKKLAADADREATRLRENELRIGEIRNRQVETNFKTNQQIKERQTLDALSLDRQTPI